MMTLEDCLKIETYWDEYKRKSKAYDVQIDKEWSVFPAWDDMTEGQKEMACVIAERQGNKQVKMFDDYLKKTGRNPALRHTYLVPLEELRYG